MVPSGLSQRLQVAQDLLGVEAPQLLGPDAVPQNARKPQSHADLYRAEDHVVHVAARKIDPENGENVLLLHLLGNSFISNSALDFGIPSTV